MSVKSTRRFGLVLLAKLGLLLCIAIPAFAQENPILSPKKEERWVAYYGDKLPPERFVHFDTIVFDSNKHPALSNLSNRGKTLLGYLSLGEAETFRPHFEKMKSQGLLLSENADWPGHFAIDIRNPAWSKLVVETLIPSILHRGFNGVMLDTLDTSLELETRDPKRYAGMREAAIRLIRAIRIHYPTMPILLNRAFPILPEVGQNIQMILAESTYTTYHFGTGKHSKRPTESYLADMATLRDIRSKYPALKAYSLDYWSANDTQTMDEIYAAQRKQGLIPYVATIDLQTIQDKATTKAPEPKPQEPKP